jgi:sporulation protein YlmC with PRC-barrel domain
MAHDDRSITPGGAREHEHALLHSRDMDHFRIPDGDPDPRGWDVRNASGRSLGKVADLLVDSSTGRVRYLEVSVDKDVVKEGAREYLLVPVGTARLDDDKDDVIVNFEVADLAEVPLYQRGGVSREYEQSLRTHLGRRSSSTAATAGTVGAVGSAGIVRGADTIGTADTASTERDTDFYAGPEYDDRSFFGGRRRGSAHQSAQGVGGRLADAVDDVKDRVDGNPASRPGPDATDRPNYGTGMAGDAARSGNRIADATEHGAHRAGNALDDLKDRVDGDPASRPGPDATDRPGRL